MGLNSGKIGLIVAKGKEQMSEAIGMIGFVEVE